MRRPRPASPHRRPKRTACALSPATEQWRYKLDANQCIDVENHIATNAQFLLTNFGMAGLLSLANDPPEFMPFGAPCAPNLN